MARLGAEQVQSLRSLFSQTDDTFGIPIHKRKLAFDAKKPLIAGLLRGRFAP